MFRRDVVPAPGPVAMTSEPAPRPEKRLAHESKIFTEGQTFAERKAAAAANQAQRAQRRLVSMGETEFPQRNTRTGETEYLPAELFCDVDKPIERFIQIAGMPGMHPIHSVTGKEEKVTPIPGIVRTRGPSQLTTPALADPPVRAV